jgi:hypothetical protein
VETREQIKPEAKMTYQNSNWSLEIDRLSDGSKVYNVRNKPDGTHIYAADEAAAYRIIACLEKDSV